MPTRRIADLPTTCSSPDHNPPAHQVFTPGVYLHTCPSCGQTQTFTVLRPSWMSVNTGTPTRTSWFT